MMDFEQVDVQKSLTTILTLVILYFAVCQIVQFEGTFVKKSLSTFVTDMRFFFVTDTVVLQVFVKSRDITESFSAFVAMKWFFSCMAGLMLFEALF